MPTVWMHRDAAMETSRHSPACCYNENNIVHSLVSLDLRLREGSSKKLPRVMSNTESGPNQHPAGLAFRSGAEKS